MEKTCIICGKQFETNHSNTVTCSPECNFKRRRQTQRNHILNTGKVTLKIKNCKICGEQFETYRSYQVCCSKECSNKNTVTNNAQEPSLPMSAELLKDFDEYLITTNGQIFNKSGKELKPSKNQNGFLKITLRRNNSSIYSSVHHLVYKQFKGDYIGELVFIDGNKENCNINNLITIKELLNFYKANKS